MAVKLQIPMSNKSEIWLGHDQTIKVLYRPYLIFPICQFQLFS